MTWISHPNVAEVIQNAGYLFWNPTNLSGEATWGTKLGYSEGGITFKPNLAFASLSEEETGEEVTREVFLGGRPELTCVLMNWNTTAIARLFPGMGGTSKANSPSTILSGKVISGDSSLYAPLLYVPNDTSRHPCLLLQKAVPHAVKSASLKLSHVDRLLLGFQFLALRKTSDADGIWYIGPLSGAVLR